MTQASMHLYRERLNCNFRELDAVFDTYMAHALQSLTPKGIDEYLEEAHFLGRMGRGVEPVLVFLAHWPILATQLGEASLPSLMAFIRQIWKSPNNGAITPFLKTLPNIAQKLPKPELLAQYFSISLRLMKDTSVSIHGIHPTYASPSLVNFFEHSAQILSVLNIDGLGRWVDYGIRNYKHHPDQQRDYFLNQSSDSQAVVQRERRGTLFARHQRLLDLYLQSLWTDSALLIPYPTYGVAPATLPTCPYYDPQGIRLPDVYEDRADISGINRYRAALAHMAAHRRWSTPIFADNFSPTQRLAIEYLEDARVEQLAIREYPGLRSLFLALHPKPIEGACDPTTHACQRHRITMLSYAILNPNHGYQDANLHLFANRFHAALAQSDSSTEAIAELALAYVAKTRLQSDQLANTFFENTQIDYRDDNRHLWRFHELSDDEEMFDEPIKAHSTQEIEPLPPRLYPEWDYTSQSYRPDWVSLYERAHPAGLASIIDDLLIKHAGLIKRLKQTLDLLKPQNRTRIRYQEEGSELDLDVAIQSLIDLQTTAHFEPRINFDHTTNGRSIAVTLLLDLSESLNEKIVGAEQTILQLSLEAISILAFAIEQLGDPFAIAGFHSNTRKDVRYLHLKGFDEHWGVEVKSRLAAMQAHYSTRMGAAIRHAAHYLATQKTDKKLLLILTDGEPSDIDVHDPALLIADARQAVQELEQQDIFTYCINLDPKADDYVTDIFGHQYTVIDHIEQLPEQLLRLFMTLTR